MEKFKIISCKRESMVKSIRIGKEMNDKLMLISKSTGVSYNGIVLRCIKYAIDNI